MEKGMEEQRSVKEEIRKNIIGYITAAFGFVAGLAWNDAIRSLIEYWYPAQGDGLLAKFIYAFVLTVILVLVTINVARLMKR